MKYYCYKTRVGTFYIKQSKTDPKLFQLWIEDELLGSYSSPNLAAEEVFMQTTGYHNWDCLDGSPSNPNDLSEWEEITS